MKLTFRKKGINPEIKKRILLLAIIFIISTAVFEVVLNLRTKEVESTPSSSLLPLVSMEAYGEEINLLHGYKSEMNGVFMRDAVVPLPEDLTLPVKIYTYGRKVSDFSYEIRSTDTERKIADTSVPIETKSKDLITLTLPLENLVDTGEEYLLLIKLKADKENLTFYTRIVLPPENNDIEKSMDFVKSFHDITFNHDVKSAATYMETDPYTDEDTLFNVTLSSTVDQVCWGDFYCDIVGSPVLSITDIGGIYNALEMNYRVYRDNENGKREYYDVREYFKVRQGIERMYMLDYKRTMNLVLDPSLVEADENILTVGITDPDVNYLSNETGTIVSFVQNGELFLYDINNGEFLRVFSFSNKDYEDPRENYKEHDIRLLSIDETGSVDFVVYGYINSGAHEGKCGTILYHFDSNTDQVKEQVFIESGMSYQVLKADYNDLIYKSTADRFYIMTDGTLLSVNLKNMKKTEVFTDLSKNRYASSRSGRFLAWTDDEYLSNELHVMDLEDETEFKITPDNKEDHIRVLSFMEEDLCYGIIRDEDIGSDENESKLYPVSEIRIEEVNRKTYEILKDYVPKDNMKIKGVRREDDTLYISLLKLNAAGKYEDAGEDTIRNSSGALNQSVTIKTAVKEIYGSVVNLIMAEQSGLSSAESIKTIEAGLVLPETSDEITVKTENDEERYYVYVGAEVLFSGSDVIEAIKTADELSGIVIDNTQRYIWKRGAASFVTPLKDPESLIASDDLKEIDLTGATLSEMFYYIYHKTPVKTFDENKKAYLITGYDAVEVYVYNLETKKTERVSIEDAEKRFKTFICFI